MIRDCYRKLLFKYMKIEYSCNFAKFKTSPAVCSILFSYLNLLILLTAF